jgi:putative phosphoesterase
VKLAIIADTHLPRGSRRLPDECIRRLASADLILHAGDFSSMEVLRDLEALAPVAGVLGNNDEPALAEVLPEQRVVEADGVRIGMLHDGGRRDGREQRLGTRFAGCDAVVSGHSHVPEISRYGGMWILNPGSPTERRRAPSRSMIEAEASSRAFRAQLVTLSP